MRYKEVWEPLISASQPLIWAPISNWWFDFVQRSHNYTETKLWVFFLGFRTPNRRTFLMGSMGQWQRQRRRQRQTLWGFFLQQQQWPHHWVLNKFDSGDLITESWMRLERVWVSQSLNQIRVWWISEDEILRLERLSIHGGWGEREFENRERKGFKS